MLLAVEHTPATAAASAADGVGMIAELCMREGAAAPELNRPGADAVCTVGCCTVL